MDRLRSTFHPLSSPACCQWALQSDVTITNWSLVGQGRLVARIEGALYNDRTNGSGTGPDINRPGTQVGDAFAAINMGNTAVTYDVFRCDSANCSVLPPCSSPRPWEQWRWGAPTRC